MTTKRSEFFAGIKNVIPILMGAAPFGLIYGVSARSASIPVIAGQSMSFIVFAGSAQFITTQLIGASVPAGIIILTAFIVNLRHALYSASLTPYLKQLNTRWRLILAYLLTDEAYAVAIIHYQKPGDMSRKHWYFLGAGLALWCTWQISTAVGIVLGTQVPANWSLDFALPLTFIALVVPSLKDRAGTAVAATAGIIAIFAAGMPFKLGLVVATVVGISIGIFLDSRNNKRPRSHKEEEMSQISSHAEPPMATQVKHTEKGEE